MLENITITIFVIIACIVSAIAHERDMFSNLQKYGDAKAWTCEIKSSEMKK